MAEMQMSTDPVCGMKVCATDHAMEYKGTTYAFCSGHCQKKFAAEPEKYLAAAAQGQKKAGGCCG
jgi:YHS domain-containing protein